MRRSLRLNMRPTPHRVLPVAAAIVLAAAASSSAQRFEGVPGYHHPLSHMQPPGKAAYWHGAAWKYRPGDLQVIQVKLPGRATAAVYKSPQRAVPLDQQKAALGVGYVYRLRITGLPDFPGASIYPTVELLDRLHPPAGRAWDFPVPIELTAEEIELALAGRMITRVIYLEQPQLAVGAAGPLPAAALPPSRNLLAEADRRGRPMAIIRLGGRVPSASNEAAFFGPGGPVLIPDREHASGEQSRSTVPAEPSVAGRAAGNRSSLAAHRAYPDEYVFDGGDRGYPVHYDRFHRRGVETEDAIVEFTTGDGRRHVQPTNRVAVYAPRFAAVRSVSGAEAGISDVKAAGTDTAIRGGRLGGRVLLTQQIEKLRPGSLRRRSRASRFDVEELPAGVDHRASAAAHEKLINVYENLVFLRSGRFVQTEEARLAAAIRAALVWTRDQNPVIVGSLAAGQKVQASFRPQEMVGRDAKKRPGRLRIVKLADRNVARPGEVVTFSIRYDNLGEQPVHHIRIIDNLSPRLEYVDDSATSDRAGRLDVEDNEQGSLVLKFILDDPLPGGAGGVVTFKAKVR